MARTNLPLTKLSFDNVIDINAGTVIDQANGMIISFVTSDIPSDDDMTTLMLMVETTNGADKSVIVRKGVNPPAFRQSLGDLTVTVHAASGGGIVGPFKNSRFEQADSSIWIDFTSGITGWITAYLLPKR